MKLFELLALKNEDVSPISSKIHLAVWNGEVNPLDAYLAEEFESWQSWQTKKNFERNHIVSLVQLPGADRWLFVGCYNSIESKYIEDYSCYQYTTTEIESLNEFSGKNFSEFKENLAQVLVDKIQPISKEIKKLLSEKSFLDKILFEGYEKADKIASNKMKKIHEIMGF